MAWATRLVSSIRLSTPWFRPDLEDLASPRMQTILNTSVSVIEIIVRSFCICGHNITLIFIQCLFISLFVIRVHQPPTVRLLNTDNHQQDFVKSRSGTPFPETHPSTPRTATLTEQDILSSLSLSSKPVITPRSAPVFGFSSMQSSSAHQPPQLVKDEPREDEMDWSPTDGRNPAGGLSGRRAAGDDNSWLRPQSFFAPVKQTGLENLLEGAKIQDEPMPYQPIDTSHSTPTGHLWKWGPLYVLLIALMLASLTYTNSNWPHFIQWAV